VHEHRLAARADRPVLHGLLADLEGGTPHPRDPGAHGDVAVDAERPDEVDLVAREDQVPALEGELRVENPVDRVARLLEPAGDDGVVDVAQPVDVAEARRDLLEVHGVFDIGDC